MEAIENRIDKYFDFILDYTLRINVLSRNVSREQLARLVAESDLLAERVTLNTVVDAGSGNGLLGVPLAIRYPQKEIFLVESTAKKSKFLEEVRLFLELENVRIVHGAIQEFMHKFDRRGAAMVARGFPRNELLADFVLRRKIDQLVLITSPEKVKMIAGVMDNFRRTVYNVPSRDNLIIFSLENVSRETIKKK